jgi:hypothetical protein
MDRGRRCASLDQAVIELRRELSEACSQMANQNGEPLSEDDAAT